MSAAIGQRLRDVFVDALQIEPPSPTTDLVDGGYLDSLALVELLAAIEREFEIEVPLDELDLDRVRSLTLLDELVTERLTHAGRRAS